MYLNDDQNYMILIFDTEAMENTHPCYSSAPTPTFVLTSTELAQPTQHPPLFPVICNVYTLYSSGKNLY